MISHHFPSTIRTRDLKLRGHPDAIIIRSISAVIVKYDKAWRAISAATLSFSRYALSVNRISLHKSISAKIKF